MPRGRFVSQRRQQFGRGHPRAAVLEDAVIDLGAHGAKVTVARIGPHVGAADRQQVHAQPAQPALVAPLPFLVGPALREHPVDPALEQAGHRPPVDRVHQGQRIGAIDARLLCQHVGVGRSLLEETGDIRRGEAGIEAFPGQVGDLGGVPGILHAIGQPAGHGMGERLGQRMGGDDQGMHGELREGTGYILRVTYET